MEFIIILLILFIVSSILNIKQVFQILNLEEKNKKATSEIINLKNTIKNYDNKIKLLQAEYLKLKDYLLEKVSSCFEESNKFKEMQPLQASIEYKKILDSIETEYHKVFANSNIAIEHVSTLMADYLAYPILYEQRKMEYGDYRLRQRALRVNEIREETINILKNQYTLSYKIERDLARLKKEEIYKKVLDLSQSNIQLIPLVSKIISDIETADFESFAQSLNYGNSQQRKSRIKTIRQVRAEAKAKIENLKWAEYQLTYLISLYPMLQDVIETEYEELDISLEDITDSDPVRNYLSSEEWKQLSETEKNQLALDRYIESRKKSKWQIGRDYELYIGYLYENKGYKIDYFGSYMGLEDLGRDLIAKKGNTTLIIQCKYWSKDKLIHEKHIMQLYGSLIAYKIENNTDDIVGLLVTNITLSDTARKFADMLGIQYVENKNIGDFPRIKCNIGHDEFGQTYIYHLPMDFNTIKPKLRKKVKKWYSQSLKQNP